MPLILSVFVYIYIYSQLVDRVFDESLNFRKIPPVVNAKTPDGNSRPNEPKPQPTDVPEPPTITRRRTWSRDEVSVHCALNSHRQMENPGSQSLAFI